MAHLLFVGWSSDSQQAKQLLSDHGIPFQLFFVQSLTMQPSFWPMDERNCHKGLEEIQEYVETENRIAQLREQAIKL